MDTDERGFLGKGNSQLDRINRMDRREKPRRGEIFVESACHPSPFLFFGGAAGVLMNF